jgi:peptidyl-prolyl cis-trans isomerase D
MAPVVMWIVIIAFVGTIFFAWGMDFSSRKTQPVVGKVGNKKILYQPFARAVAMEREKLQEQSQGEVSPYRNRMVPQQVFEAEVSRILHQRVLERLSLGASTEEVYQHLKDNPPPQLQGIPYFQTEEGTFDTAKYVEFLNTPQSFEDQGMRALEAYTRGSIVPMEKLQVLIEAGKRPSASEVAREYRARNESVRYEYVKVDPVTFEVDTASIGDDEIRAYYKANTDSFFEESQAALSYVKVPKVATEADLEVYRNELMDIKKRVLSGQSTFAEEAMRESEDEGSAKSGGDLGWFSRDRMVEEFADKAFALDSGDISDPVKTRFGYHLIKVEGHRTRDTTEQVKASHILRKILPTAETLDSLEEVVDSIRTLMVAGRSEEEVKDKAAENPGIGALEGGGGSIAVDSTGLFKKGEPIPGLGHVSGATYFAFTAEIGEVSELFEDQDAFYLFQVKRRTKEGVLPLEDVRERIVRTLVEEKRAQKAREYAEELRKGLDESSTLSSLQESDPKISSGMSDTTTRREYVPVVGYNSKVTATAFGLKAGTMSEVIESDGAYFVVRPLWHARVEEIPWDSPAIARIRQDLAMAVRQKAYGQWYANLKREADIENNLDEYFMD